MTTTCRHAWVKLLPDHKELPPSTRYAYWALTKDLWKANSLICTRCGHTGYRYQGKDIANTDRSHAYMIPFALDMHRRFGVELPDEFKRFYKHENINTTPVAEQ